MENKQIIYIVVNMFEYRYQDKRSYYGAPYLTREDAQKYIIDTNKRYTNIALVLFTYEIQPAGYVTLVNNLEIECANTKSLKMTTAQMVKARNTADEVLRNTLVVIS